MLKRIFGGCGRERIAGNYVISLPVDGYADEALVALVVETDAEGKPFTSKRLAERHASKHFPEEDTKVIFVPSPRQSSGIQ